MNIIEELIKISESDLQAAKVLYKKQLYSQAVFFFQQSVEKFNKALGLFSKNIEEKDLIHSIGHFPLKIHIKNLKRQKEENLSFKKQLETNPSLGKGIKKKNINDTIKSTNKFLLKIEKLKNKSFDLSYKEIKEYIREAKHDFQLFEKEIKEGNKIKISENNLNNAKEFMKDLLKISGKKDEKSEKFLESFDVKSFEKIITLFDKGLSIISPLYISSLCLSIITYPHPFISRYPIKNLSPLNIYNKNHPIIKLFSELIYLQKRTILQFKKLDKIKIKPILDKASRIESTY